MTPEGPGLFVGEGEDGEGPDIEDKSQGRFEDVPDVAIIDDFEDQDLDEYNITKGSSGDFTIVSSTVFNGNQSLEINSPGGNGKKIRSNTGLENYPEQGSEFKIPFFFDTANDPSIRFLFGSQSDTNDNNCYRVVAKGVDNRVYFQKIESGSISTLFNNTSVNVPTGEWAEIFVSWGSSGEITIEILDNNGDNRGGGSATDTTFSSGGIGFTLAAANSSEQLFTDYARITG